MTFFPTCAASPSSSPSSSTTSAFPSSLFGSEKLLFFESHFPYLRATIQLFFLKKKLLHTRWGRGGGGGRLLRWRRRRGELEHHGNPEEFTTKKIVYFLCPISIDTRRTTDGGFFGPAWQSKFSFFSVGHGALNFRVRERRYYEISCWSKNQWLDCAFD